MPCFSLDASPWKSTTMASAASRSGQASSSRLSTWNGSSNGVMKTRPMALITSARLPFLVSTSAAPRRALRKIGGADQLRRAFDEHQRLALVPGVVTEGYGIGAGVEEFLIDRLGDAETAGGILAIDDDEIERPVPDHTRQIFRDR